MYFLACECDYMDPHESDDPNDLDDPEKTPCPKCGRFALEIYED
jgi:hypothetical protein